MKYLEAADRYINRVLAIVAGVAVFAMMLVTVYDVFLGLFARPLVGTIEIVSWLSAITAGFALGYCQQYRGHVAIEFIVAKFPQRVQAYVEVFVCLVSLLVFIFVAARLFVYAGKLQATGSVSQSLRIVEYPWVYLLGAGFIGFALSHLTQFLQAVRALFRRGLPNPE